MFHPSSEGGADQFAPRTTGFLGAKHSLTLLEMYGRSGWTYPHKDVFHSIY